MSFVGRIKAATTALLGRSGTFVTATQARSSPPERDIEAILKSYGTMPWLMANAARAAYGVGQIEWQLKATKGRRSRGEPRYVRSKLAFAPRDVRHKALRIGEGAGEIETIEHHPLLDLMSSPNTLHSWADFMLLAQLYVDLVGDAFIVIDRSAQQKAPGSRRGAPVMWWPVPPHWVKRTPTASQPTFEITVGTMRFYPPMTEVLWHRRPNPHNPYMRGVGVARSLADELDADENSAKLVNWSFYNRGRPDLLIGLPGAIQTEVSRFRDEWNASLQGLANSFKTHFVNIKPDVQRFSQDFEAMQLLGLRTQMRDTIRQAGWGHPPEILGITESSNRATIDAADLIEAKYVVLPRAESWRSFFQKHVIPEWDDRIIIDYTSPVQEDSNFRLAVASRRPEVVRVDEWRRLASLDPLGAENGGDLFLVSPGVFAFEDLTALKEQPALELSPGYGPEGLGAAQGGNEPPPSPRQLAPQRGGRRAAEEEPEEPEETRRRSYFKASRETAARRLVRAYNEAE